MRALALLLGTSNMEGLALVPATVDIEGDATHGCRRRTVSERWKRLADWSACSGMETRYGIELIGPRSLGS
jgi:hypothetical protein